MFTDLRVFHRLQPAAIQRREPRLPVGLHLRAEQLSVLAFVSTMWVVNIIFVGTRERVVHNRIGSRAGGSTPSGLLKSGAAKHAVQQYSLAKTHGHSLSAIGHRLHNKAKT